MARRSARLTVTIFTRPKSRLRRGAEGGGASSGPPRLLFKQGSICAPPATRSCVLARRGGGMPWMRQSEPTPPARVLDACRPGLSRFCAGAELDVSSVRTDEGPPPSCDCDVAKRDLRRSAPLRDSASGTSSRQQSPGGVPRDSARHPPDYHPLGSGGSRGPPRFDLNRVWSVCLMTERWQYNNPGDNGPTRQKRDSSNSVTRGGRARTCAAAV